MTVDVFRAIGFVRYTTKDRPNLSDVTNEEPFNKDDVQGYTGLLDSKTMLIAFRPSDSAIDWIRNFKFWFSRKVLPYGNKNTDIRIHDGFLSGYGSIRYLIRDRVNYFKPNRVVIVGHSFGAAIATLCAVDIQYNYSGISVECWASGSPRVGNSAFSYSYDKRVPNTVRIVNGADLVTKLPFRFFGYAHVGDKVEIGSKKGKWFSIKDHEVSSYLIAAQVAYD